MTVDERLRYLGALGILAECSPYVPEEIRETIDACFADACEHNPNLTYSRFLDRIQIEVK